MLLIDEIVRCDEASIHCRKTFRAEEFFFQGHFPGQPIVPGVIQCECCLQAGALLIAEQRGGAPAPQPATEADPVADLEAEPGATAGSPAAGLIPVATRIDGVKFKRMVRPGDTVEIEVALTERLGSAYFLTGKMTLDGKLTARLEFACALAPAEPTGAP